MTTVAQIIAVEKGKRNRAQRAFTDVYHRIQKELLFNGLRKTYVARDEDSDENLPGEYLPVQLNWDDALGEIMEAMTDLYDVVLTKDMANTRAFGRLKLTETLDHSLPVTYLLYLEKQLADLRTVVGRIPELSTTEQWTNIEGYDGLHENLPTRTVRFKKVPRNHVKSPATDKHPAQVEVYMEDTPVGDWTTIKTSGAMPHNAKVGIINRIDEVAKAVKFAREEANQTEVVQQNFAKGLFKYLFQGM